MTEIIFFNVILQYFELYSTALTPVWKQVPLVFIGLLYLLLVPLIISFYCTVQVLFFRQYLKYGFVDRKIKRKKPVAMNHEKLSD